MHLSPGFFEAVCRKPVPVDLRVLTALRSPMALDLYCWLTYRNSYLGRSTRVPWPALTAQFGADYGDQKDFKRRSVRSEVRFHPEEHSRVQRLAETVSLPLARFVREAAVGYNLRSRADSNLIRQLTRIGANLSQLTRLSSTTQQVDKGGRLQATLDRVNHMLDELLWAWTLGRSRPARRACKPRIWDLRGIRGGSQ